MNVNLKLTDGADGSIVTLTGGQVESPRVQGADDALVRHDAIGQWPGSMWARVLNGMDRPGSRAEDGDRLTTNDERPPHALRKLIHATDAHLGRSFRFHYR